MKCPLAAYILLTSQLLAQGPLEPSEGPAPTMRSLQEIWDKISSLELRSQNDGNALAALDLRLIQLKSDNQALTAILAASNISLSWTVNLVNQVSGGNGGRNFMRFSPAGNPCISFCDSISGLMFAELEEGHWKISIVDNISDVGIFNSLCFGPDGLPSIAYSDLTNKALKYAKYDGANWQKSVVDISGIPGRLNSLAFSPNGLPAILHFDGFSETMKFTQFDGNSWRSENLTSYSSGTDSPNALSLAFSSEGVPLIAYYDYLQEDLRFGRRVASGWQFTTVESSGRTGYYASLAIGPDDQPAISYVDVTHSTLKLARFNGATWDITPIQADSSIQSTSLAFGPDGQPAIGYTSGLIKFAKFNGSQWVVKIIDPWSAAGYYSSMSYGPDGFPGVCYFDTRSSKLKFAKQGIFKSH